LCTTRLGEINLQSKVKGCGGVGLRLPLAITITTNEPRTDQDNSRIFSR
jgi:hypothetical protein